MDSMTPRGRRIALVPNGHDAPRVAFRLPVNASRDETVRLIIARLSPIGRNDLLQADHALLARFYLPDGSLVIDFDVLDHGDVVHVAFDGKQFVAAATQGPRPGRVKQGLTEPSMPPPARAYMDSLREIRDGIQDNDSPQATPPFKGVARPKIGGLPPVGAALPPATSSSGGEGAILNKVMSRSVNPGGGLGGLETSRPAARGTASGFFFVSNGEGEKQAGRGGRLWVVVAMVVAVTVATFMAWMLLRSAQAAVYERLREPTCAELGNPAGCKPLPAGCHAPAPWMLPILEEAAEEALGRMPTAPFPPSESRVRTPLHARSHLEGFFFEDDGAQVARFHDAIEASTKPPLLSLGACWKRGASRAQLVPDSLVFRFYDWHVLLSADFDVEPGAGAWAEAAPDSGHMSVLAAGAVLLDHISLWDLGRKGVNVSGCDSHFWSVHHNTSLAQGSSSAAEGVAEQVASSGSPDALAAALGPLLCGYFNRSNVSADAYVAARLSSFAIANPREAYIDLLGAGRVGGGIDADARPEGRRLGSNADAPPRPPLRLPLRVPLSSRSTAGGPWRGVRRELDAALDAAMPLLLAKADYITRLLLVLSAFVAFLTVGVIVTFCRCGAPDAYLVGAGTCCCLKIEGYESAAGGGCCCVTIREVPKPRRPPDDDKDCWSVLHHGLHVCDCCEKCCD